LRRIAGVTGVRRERVHADCVEPDPDRFILTDHDGITYVSSRRQPEGDPPHPDL